MAVQTVDKLLEGAVGGQRLTSEEALYLLQSRDLLALGQAAQDVARRQARHQGVVTYVVDRNINYSNVCTSGCSFCAFWRERGHSEAYLLDREELYAKVDAVRDVVLDRGEWSAWRDHGGGD